MKNILVYVKTPQDKKFNALSSLERFTYAPTLMHASIFPYHNLEALKNWADSFKSLCLKNNIQIQLRHYKGKEIYKVG